MDVESSPLKVKSYLKEEEESKVPGNNKLGDAGGGGDNIALEKEAKAETVMVFATIKYSATGEQRIFSLTN